MRHALKWYCDEDWWWANSAVHDGGDHFVYRIARREQGWYASASSPELCMGKEIFATKKDAEAACQKNEDGMLASFARRDGRDV